MSQQLLSKRGTDLLMDAAKCFDEGTSPFNDDFLTSHKVNLDECMRLSEQIGTILRGFARANFHQQSTIFLLGAVEELTPESVQRSIDQLRTEDTLKELQGLAHI